MSAQNKLDIDWNDDIIMPQALIDILEARVDLDVEDDEQECEEDDVVDNVIDVIFDDSEV